jgi:hypothetical protein
MNDTAHDVGCDLGGAACQRDEIVGRAELRGPASGAGRAGRDGPQGHPHATAAAGASLRRRRVSRICASSVRAILHAACATTGERGSALDKPEGPVH